ncbi:MGDG synthase family glycosyltransferase [Quadrisphaera sp. KR29]|uniref:MGDG synthase family glycosyltransferase n=1 Tax=Quadrisphaera sp. KR29 TaxID=3461391 RepID=UPI00404514BB
MTAAPTGLLPTAPPAAGSAPPAPRVLVLTGSVGAGHDGAAAELAARLRAAGAVAEVRDLLDGLPRAAQLLLRDGYAVAVARTPHLFEAVFRGMERRGLVWRVEQEVCALGAGALQGWLEEVRPDVVVSTYPLSSQLLGQEAEAGRLAVPFLTYCTDPAVHASWLHPRAAAHLVVTEATAGQGRAAYPELEAAGVPFEVAGPLVPARFAERSALPELVALRTSLGLHRGEHRGRPVALLVTGSLGMGAVVPSARDVVAAGFTPLVLCGRNDALRRRAAAVPGAVALGWRRDVHDLMQLADVLVHNAGGLAVTEALVAGLPAVTYRSIPGHGRANAAVLAERGGVPWPATPGQLAAALREQHARGRLQRDWPDAARSVLARAGSSRLTASAAR